MSVPQFVPPWGWLQYIMGLHWPKGDEDGLRACAAAWREAGDALLAAGGHGDDVASKVNSAVASMSADAFTAYWDKVVQPNGILDELALQCLSVSGYADSAALELEATKISMNVVAVLMYIEFLEALAEVAATFGFGTPAVAVQLAAEEFATREALVMLAESLLKALEFTLLPDVIAQGWQVLDGSRPISKVDWSQLGHDLEHGLVLGPLFALPGIGGGLARKFDLAGRFPLLGKFSLPDNVFARTGGNLAFAGASNVAANAVTWSVDQGIQAMGVHGWAGQGGPFAGWQQAFANGVFMNGLHTAAGGIRTRYGDPKLGITTTDGQNLLLRDRMGNTVTADNPGGLFVFSQPDLTRQPDYLGRGTVDPRSGVVTVTDRTGVSTDYQAQQIHTLDRGRTTSTVGYAPVDQGSTVSGGTPLYEPVAQTVHGGGDTGLPANVSVQADASGGNQTVAYRGVGMPGADPALDRNGTVVAPGSVHVFDANAPETPRVVVAGGADVVPAGFDRAVGPNEAVVYGHDGTVQEVYSYPGSTVHGATSDQIPHAGQQAVYNPDGSFRGIELQNEAMRPQQISDAAVIAAAHQRAAAGIGLHAAAPDPAPRGELAFRTADQPPSPSVLTAAEHDARVEMASQSPATVPTDGVRRFSEQLNGTAATDHVATALATDATARQDALVGAAAEQSTVATMAGQARAAALLAGGSGSHGAGSDGFGPHGSGPHRSGGTGGHDGAEPHAPVGQTHAAEPGHGADPQGSHLDPITAERERIIQEHQRMLDTVSPEDRARIIDELVHEYEGAITEQDLGEAGKSFLLYCTEWSPSKGGIPVFNTAVAKALANLGHDVYVRVGEDTAPYFGDLRPNLRLLSPDVIPKDAEGKDVNARFLLGRPHDPSSGMPHHVDFVIGHTRFSGKEAREARDELYPDAKLIHFTHMVPRQLGEVKERDDLKMGRPPGEAAEGMDNYRTETGLVGKADLAVGVGPAIAEDVRTMIDAHRRADPAAPFPVAHEMIPGMEFIPRRARSIAGKEATVFIFGRTDVGQKGAQEAAQVVANLREQGIDVRLVVRGVPPQFVAEQRETLTRIFNGYPVEVRPATTDRAELQRDLDEADVMVMTSKAEGFGLTAQEAAAAGVPIVVPSSSGMGRWLGESGRFAPELVAGSIVEQGFTEEVPIARWIAGLRAILATPEAYDTAQERALRLQAEFVLQRVTWENEVGSLVDKAANLQPGDGPRPGSESR